MLVYRLVRKLYEDAQDSVFRMNTLVAHFGHRVCKPFADFGFFWHTRSGRICCSSCAVMFDRPPYGACAFKIHAKYHKLCPIVALHNAGEKELPCGISGCVHKDFVTYTIKDKQVICAVVKVEPFLRASFWLQVKDEVDFPVPVEEAHWVVKKP